MLASWMPLFWNFPVFWNFPLMFCNCLLHKDIWIHLLLHLRVTQNALQLTLFFFFSLFLALFLDELAKAFSQCLILLYPGLVWPVSGLFPWPHWQMFSFLFSLLLWYGFQVWVASSCLICMWKVLGTIWHVLPDQSVCAWNTSLLCELCCCYYSSYN